MENEPNHDEALPGDGEGETVGKECGAGLTRKQQVALMRLVEGESVAGSAAAAGVTRVTVHRWLREVPAFTAAYNAWQEEAITRARGQMVALTGAAVGAVRGAVERGDVKAAMAVLKSMGVMREPKRGPTSEEAAWREQEAERRREAVEEQKRVSKLEEEEFLQRMNPTY